MIKSEEVSRVQTLTLFVMLIGVGAIFFKMISIFLFPIFWAAVIASLFHPLYERFLIKLKNPALASGVTLLLITLVVLIPLSFVLVLVIQQAIGTLNYLSDPHTIALARAWVDQISNYPHVQQYAEKFDLPTKITALSTGIGTWLLSMVTESSKTSLQWALSFVIMMYTLFFFLKDGASWLQRILTQMPFGNSDEKILYETFVSTARATLKGTVVIGIIQGVIGGVLVWLTGVPSPAFWGLIMVLCCIIPNVGPMIVLVPTTIVFLILGAWWSALILILGMVGMALLDNFFRPILIRKDLQMPAVLILFSTLGGLVMFGISGIVMGPMIAAFFIALLQMVEKKYMPQKTRRVSARKSA